jgi:hypothetical protein
MLIIFLLQKWEKFVWADVIIYHTPDRWFPVYHMDLKNTLMLFS